MEVGTEAEGLVQAYGRNTSQEITCTLFPVEAVSRKLVIVTNTSHTSYIKPFGILEILYN